MPKVSQDYLDKKREMIVEAAYKVCLRKPVQMVNITDVIAETGMSQGAIYRYYASLDDILIDLVSKMRADYNIMDRLNIEDEMDKLVFDMELWYTARDLAESRGLYPLSQEAAAAAAENAEATWEHYRAIAWSNDGMAFLPAGNYQPEENDPEGNLIRYFASFGLTKEALQEKAVLDQTDEELKNDPSVDTSSPSYTNLLNERIGRKLDAISKRNNHSDND